MDRELENMCVRQAQAGDRAAYNALVDRYWIPICNWLMGLSGETHTAEDLAQETFLKAWNALPELTGEDAFRIWLFRIARNEYLALSRSPRSNKREPLADTPDPNVGPLELVETQEAETALVSAIEKLPEQFRAAYLLWTHEDLPYAEISRVLDLTEETARWRVCEARRRLAIAMQRFLGGGGR